MADLFIELTDDLSYARTFFPGSETVNYLNGLSVQLHQEIYRNKREKAKRIWDFFSRELPLLYLKHWKEMLFVALLMLVAVLIAVVSQYYDPKFADLIMGPYYVDMTIENIENGDPMGVYKGGNQLWDWIWLASNNIRVAMMAFAMGFLLSIGALWIIFSNGIMLGSFFYLFYYYGAANEWWSFVWLHGTLEIWAIVVGGTAGLVMGNSILFPKSYSRGASLARGAREGMKMALGCVPLLLVAGFIEGFVTRLTNMPHWLNLVIIFGSLTFIVWYFILHPLRLKMRMEGKNKQYVESEA